MIYKKRPTEKNLLGVFLFLFGFKIDVQKLLITNEIALKIYYEKETNH
jgi:hypothetical protein